MKIYIYTFLTIFALLALSACKPNPYPKHPNYGVTKPKVIHTPSKKSLEKMVKKLQGSPYVWAEEGPNNFDCSGFTYYMYGSMGIDIPRVARDQAKVGKKISMKSLQYGDLIFFATSSKRNKITHVGMYLGDGWFTHASTIKHQVIYSNLFTSPYYKKRLRVCRRYLPTSKTATVSASPWNTKQIIPKTITVPSNASAQQVKTMKKAIVIKSPIDNIETSTNRGHYYIQIGSFIGKPKSGLLSTITRNGYQYKIIKFPKDGKMINKLLIGPYMQRDKATKVLQKIRQTIQKDAFIAEIR
ncbi:Tn916, NLP/P60 family protein [hydrothermal vent metagenome]|uniref:Tn916, NLP/P60 family protein n=1 Tax=hydrothermal vent metagenome TaxID=652676 RepID=A0A1W1EFM5_9ZZZZ